jgi:hypothetical protein
MKTKRLPAMLLAVLTLLSFSSGCVKKAAAAMLPLITAQL